MEFSVSACLRFGWETFKKRPWFFVGVASLILIAYLVANLISGFFNAVFTASDQQSVVGFVVNWVLSAFVGMGVTMFFLKAHDNPDILDASMLAWSSQLFLNYLAATSVVGLAVMAGFILLIVPGVIVGLMFMFATYIIIDRKLGPLKAMRESMRITRGFRWHLLGLALALALVNILGMLALGVGMLVAMPVSLLALVHAYRILSGKADAIVPEGV